MLLGHVFISTKSYKYTTDKSPMVRQKDTTSIKNRVEYVKTMKRALHTQ